MSKTEGGIFANRIPEDPSKSHRGAESPATFSSFGFEKNPAALLSSLITETTVERTTIALMSVDFPAEEEKVLQRWREINAFRRQVELSQGRKPYTFYDGPPFATGLPHYGHLLASTIKDIIPRYWSMKGHFVERRFGWDTHGVPIEYEIDKKLGMSGLEAVEKIGIEKYNEECRAIVMTYASEWRETVERLGRWIDFDNDYKVNNLHVEDRERKHGISRSQTLTFY